MAGETSPTRSTFGNGLVEQQDLLLVGRLKDRRPPFKVGPCHRRSCPFAGRSAAFSSLDQLLQGRIEVVQFDTYPQCPRPESFLIPFDSCPVAPLQDHTLAPLEEILGKNPKLVFEAHSEFFVPHIGTQLRRPPVLVQPDGADLGCEPTSERRLARGRKPTDQDEPRRCRHPATVNARARFAHRDSGARTERLTTPLSDPVWVGLVERVGTSV